MFDTDGTHCYLQYIVSYLGIHNASHAVYMYNIQRQKINEADWSAVLVCHGSKTFVYEVLARFFSYLLIFHAVNLTSCLTCGRSRRGVNEVTTHTGAHAHTQLRIV